MVMSEKKSKILIIDDERNTREGLERALKAEYDVALAEDAEKGLDQITAGNFDIVLTDLRMPGLDGLSLIKRVKAMENPPDCIMLTAFGTVENAVEAMKSGAYDYLTKPINLDNLELLLKRALESRRLKRENTELRSGLAATYSFKNMIGKSAAMHQIFDTLHQIAPARSTVLLTGDSGTGKELAARALHQQSNRADKPFITVHCAALSTNLLESELFGHERGAFTGAQERRIGRFEAADGGTIFLDEIGEIEPQVQVTLLRILETRTFERVGGTATIESDVRLIAATNRDLKKQVDERKFREDLYYRLDVLHIHMPSLRGRREDIPLLLKHYLDEFNAENAKEIQGFVSEAVNVLNQYHWPGNVRELRNCVERMVVMTQNETLAVEDIPGTIRTAVAGDEGAGLTGIVGADSLDMEANERSLILKALKDCDGNRSAAARKLGISRRTLHRKLNQYKLREM